MVMSQRFALLPYSNTYLLRQDVIAEGFQKGWVGGERKARKGVGKDRQVLPYAIIISEHASLPILDILAMSYMAHVHSG